MPRRVLLVLAVVLAVAGLTLIGVAVAGQRSAPEATDRGVLTAAPPTALPAPATPSTAMPEAPAEPPARLVVPRIGVDSPVDQVGLNPDRTMEVPAKGSPGYDRAAWYRYSVSPGRRGPSVIIGHVDSREDGPSVFYELGRLAPGDPVEVTVAGRALVFDTYAVRRVPKAAFPTNEVYGPTAGPELRLITCGGDFDPSSRNYEDNTVVFARLRA